MPKRDRLEDLGRIYAKLEMLGEHDLFDDTLSPKWKIDRFYDILDKDEDKKDTELRNLYYGIEEVYHQICELICIARGDED